MIMWRSIAAIVTTLILIPLLFIAFACSADDNNGQMTGAEQDSMKTGEAAAQQVTVKTDESATDQSAVKTGENTTNTFDRAKLGTVERDIVYGTGGGVQLKVDIYYPKKLDGLAPAVMYVHGGGWTADDKKDGAGVRAIPAQIEDVKCAVRYLRANAGIYMPSTPSGLAPWAAAPAVTWYHCWESLM